MKKLYFVFVYVFQFAVGSVIAVGTGDGVEPASTCGFVEAK